MPKGKLTTVKDTMLMLQEDERGFRTEYGDILGAEIHKVHYRSSPPAEKTVRLFWNGKRIELTPFEAQLIGKALVKIGQQAAFADFNPGAKTA